MVPLPELSPETTAMRVLVVDDDVRVREVLARLLASQGYAVTEADGTDAALATLMRDGEVPLVVSDVNMPGRDGRELLREIRSRYPDTAVVMLTGDGDVSTAVDCLKLGASDYISKPFQSHEVRARIEKALAERRLTLEVRRLRESYSRDLERQVQDLSRKNQAMFLAQVQMAVTMLEAKDPYTRGHSGRVAEYAVATGRKMGISGPLLEQLRLGGELHDIGKIGTRDAVLHKAGPLTDEEFVEIRRHTVDGESMLSVLRADHPAVLHIVRWHHERLDGTGFPDGLIGEQIPITARIVSVVDAFDAMTTTRAYRKNQSADDSWAELQRCAGKQFDPEVVEAFRAAFPDAMVLPA
jgi:response regulator RpfG family c-di-GMP phosphodiesterase